MEFYLKYAGVLPACVSMHHLHAVPVEVRRGLYILTRTTNGWLLAALLLL